LTDSATVFLFMAVIILGNRWLAFSMTAIGGQSVLQKMPLQTWFWAFWILIFCCREWLPYFCWTRNLQINI